MSRTCQGRFRFPSAAAQGGSEESPSSLGLSLGMKQSPQDKNSHPFSGFTGSGLYLRKQINELESLILTSATL